MANNYEGWLCEESLKGPPRDPFKYILNLEANLHSFLSFAWTLAPQIICDKNIVFSYPEMIRVSFPLFLSVTVSSYFRLLLIFTKVILLLLLYFFHENYFYFFMFRDVPESSGMFCVPGFIDAPILAVVIHSL